MASEYSPVEAARSFPSRGQRTMCLKHIACFLAITMVAASAGCSHSGTLDARSPAPDVLAIEMPDIDAAASRGDGIDRLLQRLGSVRVRHGSFRTDDEGYQPMICIESTRGWSGPVGAGAEARTDGSRCNMVTVVLDDLTMAQPGPMLRAIPLAAFQRIVYLTGPQAGFRFGYAGARNGVLLLYTRRNHPSEGSRF